MSANIQQRKRKVGKVDERLYKAISGTKGYGKQTDFAKAFGVSTGTIKKCWDCKTYADYLKANEIIKNKIYEAQGKKKNPTLFEADKLKEEEFLNTARELGYEVMPKEKSKPRKSWKWWGQGV